MRDDSVNGMLTGFALKFDPVMRYLTRDYDYS